MARKLRLFGRDIWIGKGLFGYGTDPDVYFGMYGQKFGIDNSSANRLRAYKGIVYACVKLIAEQCGAYEPYIKVRKKDQWEDIGDHPFLQLLQHPSGLDPDKAGSYSMFDLFTATATFISLQGGCYWYIANGKFSGQPREIIILRKDRVGTDIDRNTGEITGYFIRRAIGDPIPLEIREVLPFKELDPQNVYNGYGTTEAAADYIAADESTARYTKNFFKNNAGISGILNIKGEVTKGAFKKFVRAWRDKHEGEDNFGKAAIVRDSEAAFTKIGLGLDELDMSALRKMTLQDVCMMFMVPPELLGRITEGSGLGRANIETLEYIFSKYNIDVKLKRFDDIMQIFLERFYNVAPNTLVVDHRDIIPADKEFELAKRDKGVDRWVTRNELRDEDGKDSIDGGDQLFLPLSSVPINEDFSASDTPATPPAKGIKIIRRRFIKKKEISSVAKENFRLKLQRNQTAYERHYKNALKPIFKDQRAEALYNLEAHAGSLNKAFESKLFDDAAADKLMVDKLTPVLSDLSQQQGALALIFAGDDESDFKLNAPIQNFIRQSTQKMAGNFNDETITRLNKTLTEGIAEGENIQKLRARVESVYDDIDRARSLRLARTETLKASNNATEWAYKQTGYVTAKEWYVNPDACPICEPFQGKTIGLGESFAKQGETLSYTDANGDEQSYAVDYDDVDNPPLHPNCRCTIIPVR